MAKRAWTVEPPVFEFFARPTMTNQEYSVHRTQCTEEDECHGEIKKERCWDKHSSSIIVVILI